MKRRVLSVLLCAGLVVSVLAGCGSDDAKKDSGKKAASESDLDYVKEKGTLVVGITNFEPMDYQDEEGEWIGFDADMATGSFRRSCRARPRRRCRVCGD